MKLSIDCQPPLAVSAGASHFGRKLPAHGPSTATLPYARTFSKIQGSGLCPRRDPYRNRIHIGTGHQSEYRSSAVPDVCSRQSNPDRAPFMEHVDRGARFRILVMGCGWCRSDSPGWLGSGSRREPLDPWSDPARSGWRPRRRWTGARHRSGSSGCGRWFLRARW